MPFTHGHLYVASSRVLSPDNIAYYFDVEKADLVATHEKSVVTNIVYNKLNITNLNNIIDDEPIAPVHWGALSIGVEDWTLCTL